MPILTPVMLTEKSAAACAVTSWRDQLYVAWTGTDLHLNVISSPGWGEFGAKTRLPDRSYKRVTRNTSSDTGSSGTEIVAMPPSVAGSGEHLYLAWTGGDGALNASAAEPGGPAAPARFRERSTHAPSISAAAGGGLALAWTGTDGHVNAAGVAGGWPGPPVLGQPKNRLEQARSGHAPALCSHNGTLVLAWTGTDRRVNLLSGADSPAAPAIRLEQAKTSQAPALCSHNGTLVLAWTGTDRRPNLALVQLAD